MKPILKASLVFTKHQAALEQLFFQLTINMTTIQQQQWRYACKKFDATKQLTQQQVKALGQAFNLTATSYGLQPMKLIVVHNKALQEKLVPASYGQNQVFEASHVLVLCAQKDMEEQHIQDYFERVKELRNTPDEILNPFKKHLLHWASNTKQEDLEQWARKQTYIALGNLLNTCAALEIDSCPMEGFNPEAYDELLELKGSNFTSSLVLPVGFRHDEDYMAGLAKVRKKEEDIIEFR